MEQCHKKISESLKSMLKDHKLRDLKKNSYILLKALEQVVMVLKQKLVNT